MADVEVQELTREQGHEMFDNLARKSLGIGREEFLYLLDHGRLPRDEQEHDAVVKLRMLVAFAR